VRKMYNFRVCGSDREREGVWKTYSTRDQPLEKLHTPTRFGLTFYLYESHSISYTSFTMHISEAYL
jgi:hypothetical protein